VQLLSVDRVPLAEKGEEAALGHRRIHLDSVALGERPKSRMGGHPEPGGRLDYRRQPTAILLLGIRFFFSFFLAIFFVLIFISTYSCLCASIFGFQFQFSDFNFKKSDFNFNFNQNYAK
jgi:hypothetical protein